MQNPTDIPSVSELRNLREFLIIEFFESLNSFYSKVNKEILTLNSKGYRKYNIDIPENLNEEINLIKDAYRNKGYIISVKQDKEYPTNFILTLNW